MTPLRRFVQDRGAPVWRLRAEQVLSALERQAGPDAINTLEPIELSDHSFAIGTNHQRSPFQLLAALFLFGLAALFVYRVLLPAQTPGDVSWAYVIPSLFAAFGLVSLVLFLKSPTADSILIVDSTAAYAAWRSGLTVFPRQSEVELRTHTVALSVVSRRHTNVDYHFVTVSRVLRENGRRARLFTVRVDDAGRDYWLRFATELSVARTPAGP